jgi:non-ribosomal peptide synthetase component E (peptide arylation enzyme)
MASLTPKLLFLGNQQSGSVYSSQSTEGSYSIIKSINVCNTSETTQEFSINLVLSNNVAASSNLIVGSVPLSGKNVFSYDTSIVMPAGSFISISQPSTDLTFTISGVEYVI